MWPVIGNKNGQKKEIILISWHWDFFITLKEDEFNDFVC